MRTFGLAAVIVIALLVLFAEVREYDEQLEQREAGAQRDLATATN